MRDMALEFGEEWDEEGEDSDSEQALDQLQLRETDEDENELDVVSAARRAKSWKS